MIQRFISSAQLFYAALLLIAMYSISMPAIAQNSVQNSDDVASEQAERLRIGRERSQLKQRLELQRQACYQKLAVTPCLNEARDEHNEKMRDLKRQEVALNDVQRKRAAADRQRAMDERNSPQAQQNLAERRGKAIAASERREASRIARETNRSVKITEGASRVAPVLPQDSQASVISSASVSSSPQGKPRAQKPDKSKAIDAAKLARHREQALARETEAARRQKKAQERESSRKKPPAKPLPRPALPVPAS